MYELKSNIYFNRQSKNRTPIIRKDLECVLSKAQAFLETVLGCWH